MSEPWGNPAGEIARLQRERDLMYSRHEAARRIARRQTERAEAVSAQLASAVARIAELGAENGRLFTKLAETRASLEDSQREAGTHKLNDTGLCPMCYDAGYADALAITPTNPADKIARAKEAREMGRKLREETV